MAAKERANAGADRRGGVLGADTADAGGLVESALVLAHDHHSQRRHALVALGCQMNHGKLRSLDVITGCAALIVGHHIGTNATVAIGFVARNRRTE
jgi:hypothetical protein